MVKFSSKLAVSLSGLIKHSNDSSSSTYFPMLLSSLLPQLVKETRKIVNNKLVNVFKKFI